MNISFATENKADARRLIQELEEALIARGVPSGALSLRQSSAENMDVGSVLGVTFGDAAHALGSIGYIACFAKCIFEVASKHRSPVVLVDEDGKIVKIPLSQLTFAGLEQTLKTGAAPQGPAA